MFIIGAQKSGTTSLFDQMAYQGACGGGAKLKDKEAHFFDDTWPATEAQYTKRFGGMGSATCKYNLYMDATPDYIRHWFAPQRMHDLMPAQQHGHVRLIALLREPVSRDLSYYNHMLGNHMTDKREHPRPISAGLGEHVCSPSYLAAEEKLHSAPSYKSYVECELQIWQGCVAKAGGDRHASYEACQGQETRYSRTGGATGMTFLSSGMYAPQLKRWGASWPRQQLMVVQMEALLDHTGEYMRAVYDFLGFPAPSPQRLPDRNEKDFPFTVHGIECPLKARLKAIFEPWNQDLYTMLQQDKAAASAPATEPGFPSFPDTLKCHEPGDAADAELADAGSHALQPQ